MTEKHPHHHEPTEDRPPESRDALSRLVQKWKPPVVSQDFSMNVMARIAEHNHHRSSIRNWLNHLFRQRLMVPVPVGALASLALMVSLCANVVFLMEAPRPSPSLYVQQPASPDPSTTSEMPPATVSVSMNPSSAHLFHPTTSSELGVGTFLLIPVQPKHPAWLIDSKTFEVQPEAEL